MTSRSLRKNADQGRRAEHPSDLAGLTPDARVRSAKLVAVLTRYAAAAVLLNLLWEIAQFPLYALWSTGSTRGIVFAALHCTAGDLLIAISSLVIAIILLGQRAWPARNFVHVALTAVVVGIGYTAFSEWLNVYVRHSWAYSPWMPILPWVGIGASPLAQWLLVPTAGLAWARVRVL